MDFFGGKTLLSKQEEFSHSQAKFRAFIGGFGSGKTYIGCKEGQRLSLIYPGNRGVICRNTYPELRDTTMQTFFEQCPEEWIYSFNKNENLLTLKETTVGKGRSQILFRSLDSPEKFKSLEIGWFFIDEGSEVDEEAFLILSGRLRHKKAGRLCGFITSNPSNIGHWMHERFAKNPSHEYELFVSPTYENRKNLPDGYIESMEAAYDPTWVKRYLNGEFGFIAEGKPVYPEFSEQAHVAAVQFNPHLPLILSWDFGLHHPAVVIGQIDRSRLIILKEIMGKDILIEDFAKEVQTFCKENYQTTTGMPVTYEHYCDPAGNQRSDKSPRTSVEILRGLGMYPRSRPQFILDGVQIVRMMLHRKWSDGRPALLIHPSCTILKEGFLGGYHYPEKYKGQGEDPKPEKDGRYDHLQDCIRYLIWNTEFKSWIKTPLRKRETAASFNSWRKNIGKQRGGATVSFRVKA